VLFVAPLPVHIGFSPSRTANHQYEHDEYTYSSNLPSGDSIVDGIERTEDKSPIQAATGPIPAPLFQFVRLQFILPNNYNNDRVPYAYFSVSQLQVFPSWIHRRSGLSGIEKYRLPRTLEHQIRNSKSCWHST